MFFVLRNYSLIHFLLHLVAISLEASGYVHNGSTVHYDAAAAQLELQLKMVIHPLSSKGKSHQRGNDYRVELALVDGSKKMMNDTQFAACNLAFSRFAGYCKERHIFTPIYQNYSHNHTVKNKLKTLISVLFT
jgi:hypothetical protein